MDYFPGLDTSLETVNVCIVNADGSVVLEQKVGAEPQAMLHFEAVWASFEARWFGSRPDIVLAVH